MHDFTFCASGRQGVTFKLVMKDFLFYQNSSYFYGYMEFMKSSIIKIFQIGNCSFQGRSYYIVLFNERMRTIHITRNGKFQVWKSRSGKTVMKAKIGFLKRTRHKIEDNYHFQPIIWYLGNFSYYPKVSGIAPRRGEFSKICKNSHENCII